MFKHIPVYVLTYRIGLSYGKSVRSDQYGRTVPLKVHKIEIFFGFDFEICIISLLVMWKY
jgi:hypothetical protein